MTDPILSRLPHRTIVTSALPYVSGAKHLGNLTGSVLPADVHARFRRLLGHDVSFICGTDEHGTPAELAALEAGLPPDEYCRRAHALQADEWARFDVSFDLFGRSSSEACRDEARAEFLALHEAGLLVPTVRRVPWGETSQRFLPDRLVVGGCPSCGARVRGGETCEICGAEPSVSELRDPQSLVVPGEHVTTRDSHHLALDLPALRERIEANLRDKPFSDFVRAESQQWLRDLRPRDITRDCPWGVPVPLPGWEDKTLYVWFDAPIAYRGLLRELRDARGNSDPLDSNADWTAFLAKDNVAFHSVWFPALSLGGRGLPTPDRISGHGWLLWGDGKFSTSGGAGLSVAQALELHTPSHWRWWLAANAPEDGRDVRFDEAAFREGTDAALSNGVGNLVSRLGGLATRFGGCFLQPATDERTVRLFESTEAAVRDASHGYAALSTRRACEALLRGWSACDAYLGDVAPWATFKTDPDEARRQVRAGVAACSRLVRAALPVIPTLGAELLKALGDEGRAAEWPGLYADDVLTSVHEVFPRKGPPLAARLSESQH